LIVALAACTTAPDPDSVYRPTESVIEVLALLRLHRDDDTYRFPPARDFTGKNIYRASLTRLENLEALYGARFESGFLLAEVLFAKGLALERIAEYELAARHYQRVAELDTILAAPAARATEICERLEAARLIAPEPCAPVEEALGRFDERSRQLEELLAEVGETHYRAVVREEVERADVARARYFDARRSLEPALSALALQQYQVLVQQHAESKNRNRHLLGLADLYSSLSRQYAESSPPTSLRFDPATFDEYAYGATRLYEAVSQEDGTPEKIEAARKLEAFLSYTLEIHDQRIPLR
jgi:hypothetical protein